MCDTATPTSNVRRTGAYLRQLRRRERGRSNYTRNKAAVNTRHRSHDKVRRADIFTANRRRFDELLRRQEDVSRLRGLIIQRREALEAAREEVGLMLKNAEPRHHCGAKLFAKGSRGICCKHGKLVLPRLPPLPPIPEDMYSPPDPWAQNFRKHSTLPRVCNCRCNFASMNVEDRELKKMFALPAQRSG